MIISELISGIRGMNKEWSADSRITDRFIFNEAVSIKNILLKQEEQKGRLYSSNALFKTLNKVELIEVDTIEACGIDIDCKIKRTKVPLPTILDTNNGYVMTVTSLDGTKKVTYISEASWIRKVGINDKHSRKEYFFYWRGDHVYFPNVEWDFVRVEALFADPELIDTLNDCDNKSSCVSAYDKDFPLPNYLDKSLKDMLNESLLRYYHRFQPDQTVNKNV